VNLSLDDIINIMNSKCVTKRTIIGLEGGEFILHPEADKILGWFDTHHPNYTLLSNCLAANKIISSVKNHHPKHLYISLDGNKETYRYMRGRDGYDNIIEVVEACKDLVPVSLMFCLSPWNSFEDMEHVIGIARKYDIAVSTVQASYTSKMCPMCGCIEDGNRPDQETFECIECGHKDNADFNAAKNIRNRVLVTVLRDKLLKQLDNGAFEPRLLSRDKVKEVLLSFRRSLPKVGSECIGNCIMSSEYV